MIPPLDTPVVGKVCICGRNIIKNGEEECDECRKTQTRLEGYMLRKATRKHNVQKLRKEWFSLLGRELYYYKNKRESKHKNLYVLVGVYIVKEEQELFMNELPLYPFTLVFPHK